MINFGILFSGFSQTVGEVEFKKGRSAGSFGVKKMKKAPKKIYIAEFNVNYQMMYNRTDIARGGRELGGGYRGDAKASLILGIPNIAEQDVQQITDDLYKEYVSQLEAAGYEIVSADAAAQADTYEDWQRLQGGTISLSQFPGYIATAPTGYDYFVKKITEKGRAKTSMFDYAGKLSKNMDGTLVAKINLAIPFVQEAESTGSKMLKKTLGGLAKVVAEPYLRLSPSEAVQTGKTSSTSVNTASSYTYFESLGKQGLINFNLKDPVEIEGIFEKKKYKAVESADQDIWGTQMGILQVFRFDDKEVTRMQAVPCDPEKYKKGVREVGMKYINANVAGFLEQVAK